jgi:hypothetical protein
MISNPESFFLRATLASCLVASVFAFHANPSFTRAGSSLQMVAVDPSVITKKQYEDVCGASFNEQSLHERLAATKFFIQST